MNKINLTKQNSPHLASIGLKIPGFTDWQRESFEARFWKLRKLINKSWKFMILVVVDTGRAGSMIFNHPPT